MKAKRNSAAVLVLVALWIAAEASADIIERQFVEKGTGRTASGTVFQGSKNMRDLGKRKSSRKSLRVLSPIQAVPGYTYPDKPTTTKPKPEAKPQKPKPRFGYGAAKPSDGRTPVEKSQTKSAAKNSPNPKATLENHGASGPVYQFRYTYPQRRDYYYATPFHGVSPFSTPFHHGPFAPDCLDYGPRLPVPPIFSGEIPAGPISFFFGW